MTVGCPDAKCLGSDAALPKYDMTWNPTQGGAVIETTSSVAELKLTIDRLARKLDFLYKHLRVDYPDEAVPVYVLEAQELVRVGRDTEAIKIVREQTAVGIIEARAIIEDMARRVGRTLQTSEPVVPPTVSFSEVDSITPSLLDQAATDAAWRAAVRAANR